MAPQLDARHLARALTVLSRAAGRHQHLAAATADLLRPDPARTLPIAMQVVTSVEGVVDGDGTLVHVWTEESKNGTPTSTSS